MRQPLRRALLLLAAMLLVWAAIVLATGGVDWRIGGIVFRSRDASRPIGAAMFLLAVHVVVFRAQVVRDLDRITALIPVAAPIAAVICAITLFVVAVRFGTFTAGGADAYGYVSQAYAWARGVLPRAEPLPLTFPWPSSDASLAPLGYRPGPSPHTIVPTYAPGLPWLMAIATVAGPCGPFLVVPLCAGLLVWITFVLGCKVFGPGTGLMAALFIAAAPVVMFQSLWPMSDIPAGLFWTAATVFALGMSRGSVLAAGTFTAAGLLVRPNLVLLPLVLLAHLASAVRGREALMRAALFSVPIAPVVFIVAALNTTWYGGPLNTGYGASAEIYSIANIVPNLKLYAVWLWQSQSPVLLFALVPFVPPFRRAPRHAPARLLLAMFAATVLCYLPYAQFESWWYVRFFLPALPALIVLMSLGIVLVGAHIRAPWGAILVGILMAGEIAYGVRFSGMHGVFGAVQQSERRYADVGGYLARALPDEAIVLSVQHSGSARYYGGRPTIRWDLIDPAWTGQTVEAIERAGLHPYLLIEDFELPQFREWFGLAADAPPPWPLIARMREHGGVSLYDMSPGARRDVIPVALTPAAAPRCEGPKELRLRRRSQ